MHPLWLYKHQHDNRVRSKLFVACQRWWFQWQFWFVPSVPGYLREEEEHKPDPWRNPIERNHMGCIWTTRWQMLKPRQSFRITLYILAIFLVVRTNNRSDGVGGCKGSKIAPWEKLFVPLLNVRHWSHILSSLACFMLTMYLHICSALYLSRIMSAPETNRRTGRSITYAVSHRVV